MRGRNPGGPFIWAAGVVLAGLAGCDDAPNPNFEESVKAQEVARTRDEYASLSKFPRSSRYLQRSPNAREKQLNRMLSFHATYASMLERLDAALKDMGTADVAACRAAFAEVGAVGTAASVDAQVNQSAASEIFDRLGACRERAIALETTGDEKLRTASAALRRFASTGMVLVGITVVSQGDEIAGLKMWLQGEELAARDKPGFKVTPSMFRR